MNPDNVILRSNKLEAKPFRKWVTSEVLPAIRKHGMYIAEGKSESSDIALLSEAKVNNSRARLASQWLKIAGITMIAESKEICACYASAVLAGKPVLSLPESSERHYSANEVGQMLGVSGQMIGRIAKKNQLKTEQFGKWFRDKSPYSSHEIEVFKYNRAAIEEIKKLLKSRE